MPMSPEQAAIAFLTPKRDLGWQFPALPGLQRQALELPGGKLNYWRAGVGPTVLLVHGWEGTPLDLLGFAEALLRQGRSVVFIELPAHGGSSIPWTSVPHAAHALRRLGDALGPVEGVVAHSVGGALATLAMAQGLRAARVALISAPAQYRVYASGFARAMGLDEPTARGMVEHLMTQFGIDVRRVSTPDAARRLDAPALIVHSSDDSVVSVSDGEAIAAAWQGARLQRVEGLGHRRILASTEVVSTVCHFLLDPAPAQAGALVA